MAKAKAPQPIDVNITWTRGDEGEGAGWEVFLIGEPGAQVGRYALDEDGNRLLTFERDYEPDKASFCELLAALALLPQGMELGITKPAESALKKLLGIKK
jgi:hypothetical protein